MRLSQIFLLVIFYFNATAQIDLGFERLKCVGEMPSDFKTAFSEKFEADFSLNQIEEGLSKREAQEFAVLTNYFNHSLITSGAVLYGDDLTKYAESILDKLLHNHQTLRSELRVYTVKSATVNAYSTNQGIIYLTIGLYAKLESEAQLAYVLAHEVSHYSKKHVLLSFENQKEIWSRNGDYRHLGVDERTLASYKYSHEAEFEADSEGLRFYKEAGYNTNEIFTGFDALLHGYLPIKQKKYDWGKLETDSFIMSDNYKLDSCAALKPVEDVDDTHLTHPNINKRKFAIRKELEKDTVESSLPLYQVKTKQEFLTIRDLARFEMVNVFLRLGNYISALYHIQIMEEKYPDHIFLKKMEVMCWYGMMKLSTNQQKKIYSTGYRDVEGEEQALYYFASKMPYKGVTILATKFIWEQTEGMQVDSFTTILRRQSLTHLAENVKKSFLLKEYTHLLDSITNKRRIYSKRSLNSLKSAFVELFKNSEFLNAYNLAYQDKKQEDYSEYSDYEDTDDETKIDDAITGVKSYHSLSNVNKLLFISPKFFRMDLRKSIDERLLMSDKQQADLESRVEKTSKMAGIDLIFIDSLEVETYSTQRFNDFALMRDWLREESLYNGTHFYSYSSEYLPELRSAYGTDYLGINLVSHYTKRKQFKGGHLLLAAVTFYPLPLYILWQATPYQNLEYIFVVFDLKQGDAGFYDLKSFPTKYRSGVINSHLYNSFNQLNRDRNK